jgi:hypothetical protein
MIPAFDLLFEKAGVIPHKIITDRGLEFQSKQMLEYFQKKGIQKNVVYSDDIHAGMVERANRTIKERLYRYFHQSKTHRWVDVIDKITEAINNTPNRTTGIAPNSVNYENAEKLRQRLLGNSETKKPRYKIGDIVRISKNKGKFSKGYHPNYTTEEFRIRTVYRTNPPHYRIEDMEGEEIFGNFYEPELSKVLKGSGMKLKPLLWEIKL